MWCDRNWLADDAGVAKHERGLKSSNANEADTIAA